MYKCTVCVRIQRNGYGNGQNHLYICKLSRIYADTLTHFNLRKCKLNAKNAIDNMMPISASVDTTKNAIGDMVATRNLKIRFAIGTTSFFHLTGTHFRQSKSKCNFDGWNNATDCNWLFCTWLNTEMPIRSAPLNDTGPFMFSFWCHCCCCRKLLSDTTSHHTIQRWISGKKRCKERKKKTKKWHWYIIEKKVPLFWTFYWRNNNIFSIIEYKYEKSILKFIRN